MSESLELCRLCEKPLAAREDEDAAHPACLERARFLNGGPMTAAEYDARVAKGEKP